MEAEIGTTEKKKKKEKRKKKKRNPAPKLKKQGRKIVDLICGG